MRSMEFLLLELKGNETSQPVLTWWDGRGRENELGGAGRGGAGRLGIGMVNGQERADHLGTSHEAGAMMARGSGWLGHRLGELVVKMMMNGAA